MFSVKNVLLFKLDVLPVQLQNLDDHKGSQHEESRFVNYVYYIAIMRIITPL